MIKVPANVISIRERIALRNELQNEVIISALEDKLAETFTATVVSSMGETNNPSLGTAYGNTPTNNPNEQSYFFARMRRVDIDEMEKPDPFLAKTRNRARKLANMHPLGVLLKSEEGKAPQIGENWTCRYLTKDRKGIVLIQKIGVSQNFLALATKDSPFQMQAGAFGTGIVGDYSGTGQVGVWSGQLPTLGPGWKPGETLVGCFGIKVPCSELVNFARSTPVDYSAYGKNPAPSQATDDLFWSMVLQKLGTNSTANKIRFFNAWAARESSQSTNNPFATMWPGASSPWASDPNMTTYNYHQPSQKYPNGYSWVKNYSTMDAGAIATVKTIRTRKNYYANILKKLLEPNPEFPDSWFNSPEIQKEFCTWGGCSPGGDGHGYYKVVRDYYKAGKRRDKPINTNKPGGRCGRCVQT